MTASETVPISVWLEGVVVGGDVSVSPYAELCGEDGCPCGSITDWSKFKSGMCKSLMVETMSDGSLVMSAGELGYGAC